MKCGVCKSTVSQDMMRCHVGWQILDGKAQQAEFSTSFGQLSRQLALDGINGVYRTAENTSSPTPTSTSTPGPSCRPRRWRWRSPRSR